MATNDPVVDKLIEDAEAHAEKFSKVENVVSAIAAATRKGILCAIEGVDTADGSPIWIACLEVNGHDGDMLLPLARLILTKEDAERFSPLNSKIISSSEMQERLRNRLN